MSSFSLLLLLLLLLFVFLSSCAATLTIAPSASQEISFESTNVPPLVFDGIRCGNLTQLYVQPGCVLSLPQGTLPPIVFINSSSLDSTCFSFSDIVTQLPDTGSSTLSTVVVLVSPNIAIVTPNNEPLGDIEAIRKIAATGYSFILVAARVGRSILNNVNEPVCVTSDVGDWARFFESGGFLAYIVILSLLFGVFAIAAAVRLFFAIKNRQVYPMWILSSTLLLSFFRLLEVAIDYQNHLGLIKPVGYTILYQCSLVFYLIGYTFIIVAWARVVHDGLTTKLVKKIVKAMKITSIINLASASLFLITVVVRQEVRAPAVTSVMYVFLGLCVLTIFVVTVSFTFLSIKILSSINKAPQVGRAVTIKITGVTITCAFSMVTSIIVLLLYLKYSLSDTEYTFSMNLGDHVLRDLMQILFVIAVMVGFTFHSFNALTTESTNTTGKEKQTTSLSEKNVSDLIVELTPRKVEGGKVDEGMPEMGHESGLERA